MFNICARQGQLYFAISNQSLSVSRLADSGLTLTAFSGATITLALAGNIPVATTTTEITAKMQIAARYDNLDLAGDLMSISFR